MVVRGSGPFAGWDLEDPAEIRQLILALDFMLSTPPSGRIRSRPAIRRCSDVQFTSVEVLAGMSERSIMFRQAVDSFIATEEDNTAILVRAAQDLAVAATTGSHNADLAPRNEAGNRPTGSVPGNGAAVCSPILRFHYRKLLTSFHSCIRLLSADH